MNFLILELREFRKKERKKSHDRLVRLAKINLDYENLAFFKEILPGSEMWRLYPEFSNKSVYLDIETSNWHITCIGLYDGFNVKHFIRGFNLNKIDFLKELYKYKAVITFNGSSFDLPMLNRHFNHEIRLAHIDLRHVCSRIGLKGGLKQIEKTLRIKRAKEVESMLGNEAVYCWELWKHTKKRKYLDLLIKYNTEDIINLKPIAEHSINELWKQLKN